jgi:hypothetical protein
LAEVLCDWLPAVLQSVKPFFTPSDIEKGARWGKDISQELEVSMFGIFCMTQENLTRPWIMFEAGALSKRVDSSRVCPLLFGVESTDLEGPLVQFQASPFSELEVKKLVRTMNAGLGEQRLDDAVLNSVFEMWWPKLNEKVSKTLEKHAAKPDARSSRSDRDLLEEVLQLARLNASRSPKSRPSERIDGSAMAHAFKHLLVAFEHGALIEDGELLNTLKEVFAPLRFVADKAIFDAKYEVEMEASCKAIDAVLEK